MRYKVGDRVKLKEKLDNGWTYCDMQKKMAESVNFWVTIRQVCDGFYRVYEFSSCVLEENIAGE